LRFNLPQPDVSLNRAAPQSSRALAPAFNRDRNPVGKKRRRPAIPDQGDRHHDAGGRLLLHVFAALAQFERDLIRERIRAGLTAAAARGRRGGRKPVVTADRLERAKALIAKGPGVARKPAVIVLDNGPIHVSKATKKALESRARWLTVEWPPKYAPGRERG